MLSRGWKLILLSTIMLVAIFSIEVLGGDEPSFTEKEKASIAKLRSGVEDKLTHDFMKTDEYLHRWIVAKRGDVKRAQEALETALKWRKDNNIDTILTEDVTTFKKQYPVYSYGVDKGGHPIVAMHFGKWDIRKAAQTAQIPDLIRYMIRSLLEEPRVRAEELSKASGKYNSRFTLLSDLSGYNLRLHACLQCFGLYTQFVQQYENYYPEASYKSMIVNSPTIFEAVLELVKPIMSPASKRDLSMHGVRKADWVPSVLKLIDADQIPPQYGGNKKFSG